jgi:hypothetical protein
MRLGYASLDAVISDFIDGLSLCLLHAYQAEVGIIPLLSML